ncbi:MAG TPA: DUF4157 domain-containing protein [Acidimicrobiales bacterium]
MPLTASVPLTITPGAFEASVAGVRDMLYRSPIPTRAPDAPAGLAGGLVREGPAVAPSESVLDLPPAEPTALPLIEPRQVTATARTAPVTRLTSSDHPALTFAAPEPERPPVSAVPDISGPLEWSAERGFFNPNDPPPAPPTPQVDLSPKTLRMLRPRGPRRLGLGEPISEDDYVEVEIPVAAPAPPPDEPPMLVEAPEPEPEPEPSGPPKVRYIPVSGGRERVPDDLRSSMLHRYGLDVGSRLVIRDVGATEQARMLHARAFVRNAEVYMPAEAGDLDDPVTRQLLGHELAHVAQQESLGGQLPSESSLEGRALELAAQQLGAHLAGVPGVDAPPVDLVLPRSVPAVRRAVEDILTSFSGDEDLVTKGYASRAADGALVFGPASWAAAAGPVQRADADFEWQHPSGSSTFRSRLGANLDVRESAGFGGMFSRTQAEPTAAQQRATQREFEHAHETELHQMREMRERELQTEMLEELREEARQERQRQIREGVQGAERPPVERLPHAKGIELRQRLDEERPFASLDYHYALDLTPETESEHEEQAQHTTGGSATASRTGTGTGTTTSPTPRPSPHGPRTVAATSGGRTSTPPGGRGAPAVARGGGAAATSERAWEDESRSTMQGYGDFLAGGLVGGLLGGSRMESWLGTAEERREERERDPEFRASLIHRRQARERELRTEKLEELQEQQHQERQRQIREGIHSAEGPPVTRLTRQQEIEIRRTVDSEMPVHWDLGENDWVPFQSEAAETPAATPPSAPAGGTAATGTAAAGTAAPGTGTTAPTGAATTGTAATPGATAAGAPGSTPAAQHTYNHGEDREDPIFDRFASHDLDRLAKLLYERVRRQLRTELLVDRERAGMLSDHR